MKKILSISEIVRNLDLEMEPRELCAAAEAEYDDEKSILVIRLDAFVRQVHHAGADVCSRPDWLPTPELLKEGVAPDDASEMAREIFHHWTNKIRDSAAVTR